MIELDEIFGTLWFIDEIPVTVQNGKPQHPFQNGKAKSPSLELVGRSAEACTRLDHSSEMQVDYTRCTQPELIFVLRLAEAHFLW